MTKSLMIAGALALALSACNGTTSPTVPDDGTQSGVILVPVGDASVPPSGAAGTGVGGQLPVDGAGVPAGQAGGTVVVPPGGQIPVGGGGGGTTVATPSPSPIPVPSAMVPVVTPSSRPIY